MVTDLVTSTAAPNMTQQQRNSRVLLKAWRSSRSTVLGALSILTLVLGWHLATSYKLVNTLFLPPPLTVIQAMIGIITSGELWYHLGVSGEEFGIGLGISVLLGAVLGILTGWYRPVDEFLRPIIIGLNSMPHLAVIPVVILLFGIGLAPKIVIVVLSCAVTILLNTATGVQNVETHLMRMSRSFGASDIQVIRTVVLPSVVPYFMTGIRICVGRALIAVVVSEFFASKAGVGNLMISAANSFNMPRMYAMLLIITALGITLTQSATWLERRIQRWKD
jgi:ABC-type nitrate/sulfonate/bicarbonate transport system permease component